MGRLDLGIADGGVGVSVSVSPFSILSNTTDESLCSPSCKRYRVCGAAQLLQCPDDEEYSRALFVTGDTN